MLSWLAGRDRKRRVVPDGQRIVTATIDHTARVWRIVTLDDIDKLLR